MFSEGVNGGPQGNLMTVQKKKGSDMNLIKQQSSAHANPGLAVPRVSGNNIRTLNSSNLMEVPSPKGSPSSYNKAPSARSSLTKKPPQGFETLVPKPTQHSLDKKPSVLQDKRTSNVSESPLKLATKASSVARRGTKPN